MATTLRHGSDFFKVELDRVAQRAIVTRLQRAFDSRVEAEEACRPVLDVLDTLDRGSYTLLLDSRLATGVNDTTYEEWYAPFRRQIVAGFAKVAVIIRTASGRLQASRLGAKDRQAGALAIFTDVAKAIEYLDDRD